MARSVAGWSSSRRRRLVVGVAVMVALAAIAAVGWWNLGDGDTITEEPAGPEPETVLPLLGTPGRVPDRAALAVKIDTTEHGRPQSGLAEADVVFEEMVEGGLTRLLAVYQSTDPGSLGPVRSARSTDLGILAELGRPLFAWSGANPTFAAAVRAADIVDVGASAAPDAYRRTDDRSAPYNLYADPGLLREAGADDAAAAIPPAPLFSYREVDDPLSGPGSMDATGFRTTSAGTLSTEIEWSWNADRDQWVREQNGTAHEESSGTQLGAANVIVRFTPYGDSGVRDSVGAVVPEALAVGEGDAWLLSGGRAQLGRWHKASVDAQTTYVDSTGAPLQLAPGPTWVEVLPPGSGEIVEP